MPTPKPSVPQLLATFYCHRPERSLETLEVSVFGCWDSETPTGEWDFFDVYLDGICLNEGSPFYSFPTWIEVQKLLSPGE